MSTRTPLARLGPLFRLGVTVAALSALAPAAVSESEQRAQSPDPRVSLSDSDLRMITLEVMKARPLLASSSGVKHADAYRAFQVSNDGAEPIIGSMVNAHVVFHPHSETAGVKNALQAQCSREDADADWTCPIVDLRRYVRLESQEFEVRVKGDLTLEAVLALVEATRNTAVAASSDGSRGDYIASLIVPCGDEGYFVSWAEKDHRSGVLVTARLVQGGSPEERDDWESSVYQTGSQ